MKVGEPASKLNTVEKGEDMVSKPRGRRHTSLSSDAHTQTHTHERTQHTSTQMTQHAVTKEAQRGLPNCLRPHRGSRPTGGFFVVECFASK